MHGVCLGTFLLRPSPKVSGSPSQPRKQVQHFFLCFSTGYRGRVRILPGTFPGGFVHGVCLGTFCLQPSPKVSGSPSQPRKQVKPLLWCRLDGYQGSVKTSNAIPSWHLKRWNCASGMNWNLSIPAESKNTFSPSHTSKQIAPFLWCLSAAYRGSVENYQKNSFLAPSPGNCARGVPWNILSPAEYKSQRFPISAQKEGRTTFVVYFNRLPGQCMNYQKKSLLAPSPVELCKGCAFEYFASGRVQKSEVPHLSPEIR